MSAKHFADSYSPLTADITTIFQFCPWSIRLCHSAAILVQDSRQLPFSIESAAAESLASDVVLR
jgi:hypothetical protein